jgi:hypothetical protein
MQSKGDKNHVLRVIVEALPEVLRNLNESIAKQKQDNEDRKRKYRARLLERKKALEDGEEQRKKDAEAEAQKKIEEWKINRMKEEQKKIEERRERRRAFLAPWREAREKLRRGDIQEIGKRLGLKATTLSKAFGDGNTGSRNDWRILEEANRIIEARENL